MSELTNIIKALEDEFLKPLKYWQDRRIVIWYDYDKEFIDIIDNINVNNVKIHKLTDENFFYTKYLLEEEDTLSDYLIYNISKVEEINNWLMDLMLYSEKFFADRTSMFMRELNIDDSLRSIFNIYKKFFGATQRRNAFNKVVQSVSDEQTFELGILGAISKAKSLDFEEIVKSIFCESIIEEENRVYNDLNNYGVGELFWKYAMIKYGYNKEERSLKKLFYFIIATTLSGFIKEEKLRKIESYIGNNKPNCAVFIDHWLNHRTDSKYFVQYSEQFEKEMNISGIIEELDIDEYKEVDTLKAFDRGIIKYVVNGLEESVEDYEYFIDLIKSRRTKNFYDEYQSLYEALLSYLEMAKLKHKYKIGITQKNAQSLVEDYSKELYKFDYNYRKFYFHYDKNPESNIINRLKELTENLYVNWYLSQLSTSWNYAISESMRTYWSIPGIINQREFYKDNIKRMIDKGDKVFVIISDAVRYEIGREIADKLNEKVVKSTQITPMLSSIPSITKIGMASLLPHEEISIKGEGRIFIDNKDSAGLENRNQILKNNFENSIAVDFISIPKNKIEFNEMLKGYKLVYIYHNVIDATGDKPLTEKNTFTSVEDAMEDIMWLIDKITGWLGGVNIFITSDHGFLYQRSKLEESDKISRETLEIIDKSRRSIIAKEEKEIEGLFRIKLNYLGKENEELYTYIPKSGIRFKTQGAGANYVHGGTTLQEVIIPNIYYKHMRSTYKKFIETKKVEIKLLNEVKKITNNIFTLNFFQVDKIEDRIASTDYEIYMIDENKNIISNIEKIIADLENERPEERNITVKMRLKSRNYDKNKKYYLIVKDDENDVVKQEIPFIISLGIISEFDF